MVADLCSHLDFQWKAVFESGYLENRSLFAARRSSRAFLQPFTAGIINRCVRFVPRACSAGRLENTVGLCKLACRLGFAREIFCVLQDLHKNGNDNMRELICDCVFQLSTIGSLPSSRRQGAAAWLTALCDHCVEISFVLMMDATIINSERGVQILMQSARCGSVRIIHALMMAWDYHETALGRREGVSRGQMPLVQAAAAFKGHVDWLEIFPRLGIIRADTCMSKLEVHFTRIIADRGDQRALQALLCSISKCDADFVGVVLRVIKELAPHNCVAVVDDVCRLHPLPDGDTFGYGNVHVPLRKSSQTRLVFQEDSDMSGVLRNLLDEEAPSREEAIGALVTLTSMKLPCELHRIARYLDHASGEVRRAAALCVQSLEPKLYALYDIKSFADVSRPAGTHTKQAISELLYDPCRLAKAIAIVEMYYQHLKANPAYCGEDASFPRGWTLRRQDLPDEKFFYAVDVVAMHEHELEEGHCKLLWSTVAPFLLMTRDQLLEKIIGYVGSVDRLAVVCRLIRQSGTIYMQKTLRKTRRALAIEVSNYSSGQFVGGVPPALAALIEACGKPDAEGADDSSDEDSNALLSNPDDGRDYAH